MYFKNFTRQAFGLLVGLCTNFNCQAQIVLPYFQDFESEFVLSPTGCTENNCKVDFLPSLSANESRTTSRVFKNTTNNLSGTGSLGLTPTSTYSPEVIINLGNSAWETLGISFAYRSLKNGTADQRSSVLYLSYSTDDGKTFVEETLVDTFKNVSALDYKQFKYSQKISVTGKNALLLKLKGIRAEDFAGLAAKIIIDDLRIHHQQLLGATSADQYNVLRYYYSEDDVITLSKPIHGILYTIHGIEIQKITGQEIDLSNLLSGIFVLQTENGERIVITR